MIATSKCSVLDETTLPPRVRGAERRAHARARWGTRRAARNRAVEKPHSAVPHSPIRPPHERRPRLRLPDRLQSSPTPPAKCSPPGVTKPLPPPADPIRIARSHTPKPRSCDLTSKATRMKPNRAFRTTLLAVAFLCIDPMTSPAQGPETAARQRRSPLSFRRSESAHGATSARFGSKPYGRTF